MSGEISPEQARQFLRKLAPPECDGCNTPPSMIWWLSKEIGKGALQPEAAKKQFVDMFSVCEGPKPDLSSTETLCQLPKSKPEQAA
jgi:hypothetical protein